MRFATPQGFNCGDQFYAYLKDSFDTLYAEGDVAPKMLSVGLHCRLVGRPGRAASLARFLDYVLSHDRAWVPTRLDIARHWIRTHAPSGGWKPSRLTRTLFLERFGGVYEHSPWIAAAAYDAGLKADADGAEGLAKALAAAAAKGADDQKRALIQAHPDLAGRLAQARRLTAESTGEQASAGLDRLSPDELAKFTELNDAYRSRFGFPFIMAVKGKSKAEILAALRAPAGQRRGRRDRGRRSRRSTASRRSAFRRSWRERRRKSGRPRTDPPFAADPAEAGALRGLYRGRRGSRSRTGGSRRSARRATFSRRAPPDATVDDHSGALVMPGLIDAHIHYPQTQVIASYGAQLLDWLHNYTFVEEQRFADPAHCARVAEFFLAELFRCGTTTAIVYCTVHPQSAEAFFAAAERRGARMIAGKAMIDRDAPAALNRRRPARLRRKQGADRALARPRPARLCGDAALRHHLDAGAARGGRRARQGVPRRLHAVASSTRTPPKSSSRVSFFPRRATISTSMAAPGCSDRARCSAIASI